MIQVIQAFSICSVLLKPSVTTQKWVAVALA